jgi:RimJ/RimL family protein N-acetyltransferase
MAFYGCMADESPPEYRFDAENRVVGLLTRYGVSLARLQASDLELLRYWRNHPSIRGVMLDRELITEEQQKKWFASIDNDRNFYSLIVYEGNAIGVTNTKNVDLTTMTGEGGMFIWDEQHHRSIVPFKAAISGMDWMFFEFGLRRMEARVLPTNRKALRYNRMLGYVFDREVDGVLHFHATPESYARQADTIRSLLTEK